MFNGKAPHLLLHGPTFFALERIRRVAHQTGATWVALRWVKQRVSLVRPRALRKQSLVIGPPQGGGIWVTGKARTFPVVPPRVGQGGFLAPENHRVRVQGPRIKGPVPAVGGGELVSGRRRRRRACRALPPRPALVRVLLHPPPPTSFEKEVEVDENRQVGTGVFHGNLRAR